MRTIPKLNNDAKALGRYGVDVHQGTLEAALQKLFPNENIKTNVRRNARIKNPSTGSSLEIDVWFPTLHLGFEFQDVYHYITSHDSQLPLATIAKKDDVKKEALRQRGETLVPVPCWWDGHTDSLAATIRRVRPDLLTSYTPVNDFAVPIPRHPPAHFVLGSVIPHVGALMLVSFPSQHFHIDPASFSSSVSFNDGGVKFNTNNDNNNKWWLGEKYDGIRCCWVPCNPSSSSSSLSSALYTRSGRVIALPQEIKQWYPASPFVNFLDGELWCGRGMYTETQKLMAYTSDGSTDICSVDSVDSDSDETVNSGDSGSETSSLLFWAHVRTVVFDNPWQELNELPYEERYEKVLASFDVEHPFLVPAQRVHCTSNCYLHLVTRNVLAQGGEGVILQRARSMYEAGRSANLLKFKATRSDQEALVVSSVDATDSSFTLQLVDGQQFIARSIAPDITPQLLPGSIVTFTYDHYSRRLATPVNPHIYRIRHDLVWDQVLFEYHRNNRGHRGYRDHRDHRDHRDSIMVPTDFHGECAYKPLEFWELEKKSHHRMAFESFARHRHCDPLLPSTWYNLPREVYMQDKDLYKIICSYNGNVVKAIVQLFPELELKPIQFSFQPRSYWKCIANRRKLFTDLAAEIGFDPLVSTNWYNIESYAILNCKGADAVLYYYQGSVVNALLNIFPEIGLVKEEFASKPRNYWSDKANQRNHFIAYAHNKNFDPLLPQNWYNISRQDIMHFKGSSSLLVYYRGSISCALLQLFPDIGLDEDCLSTPTGSYCNEVINRRAYTQQKRLDLLVAENWYKHLFSGKNVSFAGARKSTQWIDSANQQQLFHAFARQSGNFDPLVAENWYHFTKADFRTIKGACTMLKYNGGFRKSLLIAFPNMGLDASRLAV